MSVYLALHTSGSPSIEDIAEFGRIALAMGADPKTGLIAATNGTPTGQLSIVIPIPREAQA